MKYLIMGDIHGNLVALEKVIKFFGSEVDNIICHGDVVNYGPWSNECVELLSDKGVICLQGNHEYAFIKGSYDGKNELVKEFFNKTFVSFNKLDIIKNYTLLYENDFFYVVHTLNRKYYYPDSDIEDVEINKNTIIGHSHHAFKRNTKSNKFLINTGSVGQNRSNLNEINFCLYDSDLDEYEIKMLTYDASIVIKKMMSDNYPVNCINYYKSKMK